MPWSRHHRPNASIAAATGRVDLAQFYVTHPDLIDALCTLPAKGIRVRLLTDVTMGEAAEFVPHWLMTGAAVVLLLLSLPLISRWFSLKGCRLA